MHILELSPALMNKNLQRCKPGISFFSKSSRECLAANLRAHSLRVDTDRQGDRALLKVKKEQKGRNEEGIHWEDKSDN